MSCDVCPSSPLLQPSSTSTVQGPKHSNTHQVQCNFHYNDQDYAVAAYMLQIVEIGEADP